MCNEEEPHYAKGFCRRCYKKDTGSKGYYKRAYTLNNEEESPIINKRIIF